MATVEALRALVAAARGERFRARAARPDPIRVLRSEAGCDWWYLSVDADGCLCGRIGGNGGDTPTDCEIAQAFLVASDEWRQGAVAIRIADVAFDVALTRLRAAIVMGGNNSWKAR